MVAAVEAHPEGAGTAVRITVADDLGFGLKDGMTKKYRQAVEELADALANAVTSSAPTTSLGNATNTTTSVADEITKLANLHARGVLTDEEFASEKAILSLVETPRSR